MKVVLIGARASGKTTLGAALADRLGWPFFDLDDAVRSLFHGRSVSEIWHDVGESGWRESEFKALVPLLRRSGDAIIALGGGAVTNPDVCELLKWHTNDGSRRVVLLRCEGPALAERLRCDPGDRPSLTGRPIAEEVEAVLRQRLPLYQSLAQATVDTTGLSVKDALEGLHRAINDL